MRFGVTLFFLAWLGPVGMMLPAPVQVQAAEPDPSVTVAPEERSLAPRGVFVRTPFLKKRSTILTLIKRQPC